jgi:hypothetical protein
MDGGKQEVAFVRLKIRRRGTEDPAKSLRIIPSSGENITSIKARGGSHRHYSIILCIFAYKFINNLPQLNKIASNSPPLYTMVYYKIYILYLIVL